MSTNQIQRYSATVSANLLIISLDNPQRKFHFEAFNTVIGPNNTNLS